MKTETPSVKIVAITADEAGQRIDNFLRTQLKGVPKSMIYRILRKGEVRVNKKRIKPEYKLEAGDEVRIPPVRVAEREEEAVSPHLQKVAALADSFGMDCEVHGNGAASLAVVGAIRNCRWYERGLLHPFLDYDEPAAYLNSIVDPMDDQGFVHLSQRPGLGEDINFAYIEANTVSHD